MTMETLAEGYAELAWANGERSLQLARWPYIEQRLEQLETATNLHADGITAAVLEIVKAKKK